MLNFETEHDYEDHIQTAINAKKQMNRINNPLAGIIKDQDDFIDN